MEIANTGISLADISKNGIYAIYLGGRQHDGWGRTTTLVGVVDQTGTDDSISEADIKKYTKWANSCLASMGEHSSSFCEVGKYDYIKIA